MKNRLLTTFFALIWQISTAQSDFAFSKIPPTLLKNADAVIRRFDLNFEVLDKGHAIQTEHKVITVLNERAEKYTNLPFFYDKIQEIDDLDGAVYDASGKLVRRIKKKDIADMKAYEEYVNDNRVKLLKFPRLAFPFTIEYTVKYRLNGTMFYPIFRPQESAHESVESAGFLVVMPTGMKFRVHENESAKLGRAEKNRWQFENIPAEVPESFAPVGHENTPEILCAPTDFALEGFEGNLETWKNYGLFIQKLAETRRELPPATIEKLKNLVADCPDDACKAERVYHFLQENTRYFFIGLGIGGWQPAPAAEVDALKYGDCKGLSNYLVAMLEAVGVDARYVVIRAGRENRAQFSDFPNAHFNHIIACVPNSGDTIWLECTSQTAPFGFLGEFTDDRPALLVAPDGGHLIHTPVYNERVNLTRRVTEISWDENGAARMRAQQHFEGNSQSLFSEISQVNPEFQKKYLYKLLEINDFEIDTFGFERKGGRLPSVNMMLRLRLPSFAPATGKRLFLPISLFSKTESPVSPDVPRKSPVQADSRGITEHDFTNFQVPPGFSIEGERPINIHLLSDFGNYELDFGIDEGRVSVTRKLVLSGQVFSPDRFPDLIDFLKNVAAADRTKLVLVRR